jgi:hypothetical protein
MDPVTIHISTVLQTPHDSEDYVTPDVQLKSKERVMWASNVLKILGLILLDYQGNRANASCQRPLIQPCYKITFRSGK